MQQQPQLSEMGVVRVGQIITGVMIVSLLFFAGIAFSMGQGKPSGDPFLAYFAIAVSALFVILSFIVPGIAARQTIQRQNADTSDNKYYATFQTELIIRLALLEGPGFLCGIAYIATRIWWTLGLMLVLSALMAASFPTKGRLENWIRQRRELDALDQ